MTKEMKTPPTGLYAKEAPDSTKAEIYRHNLLGFAKAPLYIAPLHQKVQGNQGPTMECVFWSTLGEAIEASIYWQTGEWWSCPESEIKRIVAIAENMGTYSRFEGAVITAALDILDIRKHGIPVYLEQKNRRDGKRLKVLVKKSWVCAKRSQDIKAYNNSIKLNIAKYGAIVWGINTDRAKLAYLEAGDRKDGLITSKSNPKFIAHATACTSYDEYMYFLPGTYAEGFGDEGVVKLLDKDAKRMFTPIAFELGWELI